MFEIVDDSALQAVRNTRSASEERTTVKNLAWMDILLHSGAIENRYNVPNSAPQNVFSKGNSFFPPLDNFHNILRSSAERHSKNIDSVLPRVRPTLGVISEPMVSIHL